MAQDVRSTPLITPLESWLRLLQVPGFGAATLRQLQQACPNFVSDYSRLSATELASLGLASQQVTALHAPVQPMVETALSWLRQSPLHFCLTLDDPGYPPLLRLLSQPPLVLFGIGPLKTLDKPHFAMVGSRNPTTYGQRNALCFAEQLAACGWVITSGLALGIDGLAHRGAIRAGAPTTAVMGSAIDQVYPKRHRRLAEEIVENEGLILSEFGPGWPTLPANFPRRNRIVSGLSYGVLMVEGAHKSGSLITARYALEQNRDVFAIPGNIRHPLSQGGNWLIKSGAKLVANIQDINEEYQNLSLTIPAELLKNLQKKPCQSLAQADLLDNVDYEATTIEFVAKRSNLPIQEVTVQLLEYELRGLVAAVPGGYVKLGGK